MIHYPCGQEDLHSPVVIFFEHGLVTDPNYYHRKTIQSGDIVYVVSSDLPNFILNTFMKLNADSRIILVSGCEDIGLPYEIFHPHRPNFFDYKLSALWPEGKRGMTMELFLADNRLDTWFIQNYDAVGCNIYTCSSLNNQTSANLLQKLVPIPIGLDLHSFGSLPTTMGISDRDHLQLFVSSQIRYIEALQSYMLPYNARMSNFIATSFECKFDRTKIGQARSRSRGEICQLLHSETFQNRIIGKKSIKLIQELKFLGKKEVYMDVQDNILVLSRSFLENVFQNKTKSKIYNSDQDYHHHHQQQQQHQQIMNDMIQAHNVGRSDIWSEKEIRRITYWITLTISRYSIAPPGFGMDTHRIWEILQFECIPIVISSPLDLLYLLFPIIILKRWDELRDPNILSKLERDIYNRFGSDPFDNHNVKSMLTMKYWQEQVNLAKLRIQPVTTS